MGRIKQSDLKGNLLEEKPMVFQTEKKESNGNGIIPVKYEYAELWYSTTDKAYFAVFKIENKKYRFEMVK